MKKKYLFLLWLPLLMSCSSQRLPESNAEFGVSPFLILKSDHSVVQNYSARLQINSAENATYRIRKVITVMNADARDEGRLVLPYGGFQEILNVEGAIYSENGKLIRRLAKDDGMDFSLSSYSLYQDTRIKMYELYNNQYPYTIVYDYELEYNGLLNLPDFYPQGGNQYVEKASLKVSVPQDLPLLHRSMNVNADLHKKLVDQDSVFSWQLTDLTPLKKEPYGKSFAEVAPRILLATESFKIADSRGKLDTWNSFGQWYYSLSKGRNELPESIKEEIRAIFNNAPSREMGIRDLYEYMQNKTRYVSIQLGIGGWQPFEASYVEEKGYGDCKALTNYMQAILNYAGVEAYPVLIKNGRSEPDIITDFPSNQFNHVVLWVPGQDTVWLESTSQTIPFNYLGFSNSNRHGLAVTPDSSFLIKTSTYDYRTNTLKNDTELQLDQEGNAVIDITTSYSGYYLDNLLANIAKKPESGRQKWIHEQYTLNSFEIKDTDFSDIDRKEKEPVLRLKISNPRYATKTGSRLFIPINKLNKWDRNLPEMDRKRTEEVDMSYSFREEDSSTFILPDGFEVEVMPESVELNSEFGMYNLNVSKDENENVIISRVLQITKRKIPAERYNELRTFFAQVSDYDSKNIVLKSL